MAEFIGTVSGTSQPREARYEYDTTEYFLFVTTDDGQERKVVVTHVREGKEIHPRPFRGDRVRYTTQARGTWDKVTVKQTLEVVDDAGRRAWQAEGEAKREAERREWQAKQEAGRQAIAVQKAEAKEATARERQQEMDAATPEVRSVMGASPLLRKQRIIRVLLDVYHYPGVDEGEGGELYVDGHGTPGTGLRRPAGALYDTPAAHRTAILRHIMVAGWIRLVEGSRHFITPEGERILRLLATCPNCDTLPSPYQLAHRVTPRFITYSEGWFCRCKVSDFKSKNQGSNTTPLGNMSRNTAAMHYRECVSMMKGGI